MASEPFVEFLRRVVPPKHLQAVLDDRAEILASWVKAEGEAEGLRVELARLKAAPAQAVEKRPVRTWVFQESDGSWAYGIALDDERSEGGFADTEREAKRALRTMLEVNAAYDERDDGPTT